MKATEILDLFGEADCAVRKSLTNIQDWGLVQENPGHSGQHYPDLEADRAALEVFHGASSAGITVLSEESGITPVNKTGLFSGTENTKVSITPKDLPEGEILIVMDPLDGSTNASKGIPFYALSLCAVDAEGLLVGYVSNLGHPKNPQKSAYTAIRGEGAKHGDRPIQSPKTNSLSDAIISVSSYPADGVPAHLQTAQQLRAFGASSLEICMVAEGTLDIFADYGRKGLAPWDYLAARLICEEAGAHIVDLRGRSLDDLGMEIRRQPLVTSSVELYEEVLELLAKDEPGQDPKSKRALSSAG